MKIDAPDAETRKSTWVRSSLFGLLDPRKPQNIDGIFASTVAIQPVTIYAPARTVWNIMVDFERYPEWNPLIRFFRCDGEKAPGHSVTFGFTFARPDTTGPLPAHDRVQHELITVWDEGSCLAYADVKPGFRNERTQYLRADSEHACTYFSFERFSGPLAPIIRILYGARIRDSFMYNALALKARAEQL